MNAIRTFKFLSFSLIAGCSIFTYSACTSCTETVKTGTDTTQTEPISKMANDATVTVWELADPDKLNPLNSTSASARYIQNNIFSRLLEYDPKTMQLAPQLAVNRPEIKELPDGGMSLSFEIRPEATWDNGKPVTAYDYLFTIKAIKNPLVNSGPLRPYYEFISEIKVDETNDKKFTLISKERYFLAEEAAGDLHVLPEYIYDAEGLMKKFEIKDLTMNNFNSLSNNPDIKRFAELFNSTKFDREEIVGSGPYAFKEWTTNQHIILERKKEWWGDKLSNVELLKAYPPQITYKVVNDQNTAVTLARDEKLDVMRGIIPQKYTELKEDPAFEKNYELSTPDQFAYYYIGINMKNQKFADKRVRRALAHLIDRDEIIETLFRGMAIKTNSPVNPNKPYYNKDLPEIKHDLDAAKKLLEEAGWKDTDGNNIVDKMIQGKKVEMKIVYKYNQGNEIRKNIGVLLKEEAQKVGIEIILEVREWTVFLEETKRREFDLICNAWSHGPGLDDMKQIWHTASDSRDGSNRVGFGTSESDKLIDEIRVTLDEEERSEKYKRIQKIIYEEQPYIFLCVPSERIVIHNRFDNIETTALRPGYREVGFKLKGSGTGANESSH